MNNKGAIIIIFIISFIGFLIFSNNIYSPYSDIGRELYIPWQIAQGKVLYKDIFCIYPPMGYLINGFIVKIFGAKLFVFTIIGYVTSILSLIACYLISKKYTNKKTALTITCALISVCVYFPSISNWITPYSYSIVYALCAFLWSFYFLIKYLNTSKDKYIVLCFLLYGLSAMCKYEFSAFIIVILLCALKNKASFKHLLYIFIFPVLCFLILLLQKCTVADLYQSAKLIINLAQSHSVNYFYNYTCFIPSLESIKNACLSIIYPSFFSIFHSLGYFILLIFIYSIKEYKRDFSFFILCLTAFLSGLKVIGNISLEIYGTYFLPLMLICLMTFLYKKLLKEKSLIVIIICSALFISYACYDINQNKLTSINTEKGTIKIPEIFYEVTNQTLNYINTSTKKDDTILVIPESAILNFLTQRQSNNKLYYLIPPNNELLTDKFITHELKTNPPDVILISNLRYNWYNQGSFSKTWGNNIYKYINESYKLEKIIGSSVQFYIYRRVIM